jgi:hypothetical protein
VSLILLIFCGLLMIAGIALVVTKHLLLALIPLAAMLLLVAVDGLVVMCEVGMVAVLGGIWRYGDQHQAQSSKGNDGTGT